MRPCTSTFPIDSSRNIRFRCTDASASVQGEVYRARDTKLAREVAIKVLPEEFAQDEERLARFEREAKLLASLNHPNIASIHGFEEADGVKAIVLELVEGPTLAERIQEGPISVEETLAIARQIAEALEAGHEAGVIHRDLKPANVKLREDGTIKVLDYGLAKALGDDATDSGLSQSPTLTRQGTKVGAILGTAAYMSPEQAKGKRVDKRTDVWAFGVVLYEMLTGRRLFAGETVTDILAAVLTQKLNFDALPRSTPEHIRRLLRRCLVRDAKRRLRDIGEARLVFEGDQELIAAGTDASTGLQWGRTMGGFVAGGLLCGLAVWVAVRPVPLEPSPSFRFSLSPSGQEAVAGSRTQTLIALSPDGSRIFYRSVAGLLATRSLGELTTRVLSGTQKARQPFVSPDGAWVGFFNGFGLQKVSSDGARAESIAQSAGTPRGASWGPDNTIVFANSTSDGLMQIAASGGEPVVLTTPALERGEGGHQWPHFLPNGKAVLFAIAEGYGAARSSKIALLDLETGQYRVVLPRGTNPRYSPTGHILYAVSNGLEAVPFDAGRLEVTGDAIPLLGDVSAKFTGRADFAVSSNTLIYIPSTPDANSILKWVGRDGAESQVLEGPIFGHPRLSSDGARVTISMEGERGVDVWIRDLSRGTGSRLTVRGTNLLSVWTHDGHQIAFASNAQSNAFLVYQQAADGASPAEPMFDNQESGLQVPTDWSRKDGTLVFVTRGRETGRDVQLLPMDGKHVPLVATEFNERAARLSPDGRWVAYITDQTGRDEIYVRPFPGPAETIPISNDGGTEPAWSPTGTELFYRDADRRMMSVAVQPKGELSPARPRVLFESAIFDSDPIGQGYANYDVSLDGKRFLMIQSRETDEAARIHVILNWAQVLKEP